MAAEFFEERQAAAVLKHGVLRRYLHIFCSKTGSASSGNRVVYLDGYAGPGVYDSGEPGSPVLAVQTAQALAKHRNLLGIYIEEEKANVAALRKYLAETDHVHVVLQGDVRARLREARDRIPADAPLFAFFDPFGLGIPFADLVDLLKRTDVRGGRRHGPPTEVLLNFSYPGLRRNAGHLQSTATAARYLKSRATILERLDSTLGGNWWREVWASGTDERANRIASEYVRRVAESTAIGGWYRAPVPRGLGGPPIYVLMFFTHHAKEGLWHFNESVSHGLEEFYEFCTRGELPLETESQRAPRMVKTIKANLVKLLEGNPAVPISEMHTEILGDVLGHARAKHLRKAIKELHKEGKTGFDGRGSLIDAVVTRP